MLPPYILNFPEPQNKTKSLKRRGADNVEDSSNQETSEQNQNQIIVKTYSLPNMGPYPFNQPRKNLIRFTPAQGK